MSVSVCLLMLVLCSYAGTTIEAYASRYKYDDEWQDERRHRRALPAVLGKILSKAETTIRRKNFGLYEKSGGYPAALSDFRLMKPTNIRTIGTTKYGIVGDRQVTLYKLRDRTWLNIFTFKEAPEGVETWSRIYYTE